MKNLKLSLTVCALFMMNSFVFAQNGQGQGQGLLWKKLQGTNDIKKHPKSGNVAIGLDTAEAKLDVAGDVNIRGELTADSAKVNGSFIISDSDSGSFIFDPNDPSPGPNHDGMRVSTGRFTIMQGFKFTIFNQIFNFTTPFVSTGIGTETPNSKLHLHHSGASNVYTLFTNGTNSNNTNGFQIGINSLGSAELRQRLALSMLFFTANVERMRLTETGRLGLGETFPLSLLHIKGQNDDVRIVRVVGSSGFGFTLGVNGDFTRSAVLGLVDVGSWHAILRSSVNLTEIYRPTKFHSKVTIGIKKITSGPHSDWKFSVDGKAIAKKFITTQVNWADDELKKELTLEDLKKEEEYVDSNSHLDGIPSGKLIEQDGLDLAEMSSMQMRKIEQVFMYLFKFRNVINELKAIIFKLKKENKAFKKDNRELREDYSDLLKRVEALEEKAE